MWFVDFYFGNVYSELEYKDGDFPLYDAFAEILKINADTETMKEIAEAMNRHWYGELPNLYKSSKKIKLNQNAQKNLLFIIKTMINNKTACDNLISHPFNNFFGLANVISSKGIKSIISEIKNKSLFEKFKNEMQESIKYFNENFINQIGDMLAIICWKEALSDKQFGLTELRQAISELRNWISFPDQFVVPEGKSANAYFEQNPQIAELSEKLKPFAKKIINDILNGQKKTFDFIDIQILVLTNYKIGDLRLTLEKFKAAVNRDEIKNSVGYLVWLKQVFVNSGYNAEEILKQENSNINDKNKISSRIKTSAENNVSLLVRVIFMLLGLDLSENKCLGRPVSYRSCWQSNSLNRPLNQKNIEIEHRHQVNFRTRN